MRSVRNSGLGDEVTGGGLKSLVKKAKTIGNVIKELKIKLYK